MIGDVRIGTNPIAWSNDDKPLLGAETPLEQCLFEARTAGFEGIELGNKFPRDAAKLGPVLERHGLELVSGWYSSKLLERSVADETIALKAHMSLLGSMGCQTIIWAETTAAIHGEEAIPLSQRPIMTSGEWKDFCRALEEMGRHVRSAGLQLVYHHHMGTVVQDESDIDRLMAGTGPEVGLLLDSGHLVYAGSSLAAVCGRYRQRIGHVHCKDVRENILAQAQSEDWSFLTAVIAGTFTVPGDGTIDFSPIFHILAQAHYCGWLVVEAEQDPAKANPLHYAKKGFRHVDALSRQTGLRS